LSSAQTAEQRDAAKSRLIMMQSLSMFVGGLPLIYMGDEWGQGNTSEAEIAKRNGPDGRELHRPQFDEVGFAKRHDLQTTEGQIFAALRTFMQAKKKHDMLNARHPLTLWDTGSKAVLGLKRGDSALGLFNFSHQTITLNPQPALTQNCMTHGTDLLTGQAIDLDGLQLQPYSAIWLKK
jgi:1,4-alpha-glucan branching enzyme